jgi:hypothetical protein
MANERQQAYLQKLRDPRWQKKRLEVMQRDGFTCQSCFDSESTLHVHHRWYVAGEPWDAPLDALVTLCEGCHENETEQRRETETHLLQSLRGLGFLATDVHTLAAAFDHLRVGYGAQEPQAAGVVSSVLQWLIYNFEDHRRAYFEHLRIEREKQEAAGAGDDSVFDFKEEPTR